MVYRKCNLLFIITLCMVGPLQATMITKEQREQMDLQSALSGAHIRLFGDEIFAKPLASENLNRWNTVINLVEKYVKKNVTLNKNLTNAMQKLKNANNKLLMVIKESYKFLSDASIKKNTAASLQYVLNDVLDVENMLEAELKKGFYLTGNQRAAEVLRFLATTIATTIEKVQRELRK